MRQGTIFFCLRAKPPLLAVGRVWCDVTPIIPNSDYEGYLVDVIEVPSGLLYSYVVSWLLVTLMQLNWCGIKWRRRHLMIRTKEVCVDVKEPRGTMRRVSTTNSTKPSEGALFLYPLFFTQFLGVLQKWRARTPSYLPPSNQPISHHTTKSNFVHNFIHFIQFSINTF